MQFYRVVCMTLFCVIRHYGAMRPPAKDVARGEPFLKREMILKTIPLIGDKGEPRQRLPAISLIVSAALSGFSFYVYIYVYKCVAERGTFIEARMRTLFWMTYLGCIDFVRTHMYKRDQRMF